MRSCSTVYFVFKMKIQEECCNVHNAQLLPWCYQLLPRHLHKMDLCNLTSLLPSILHKSSLCYSILIAKHITLVPTCVSSKAFTLVNSILQLYYTILIAYILLLAPILALPDDSKPVARFYPWRQQLGPSLQWESSLGVTSRFQVCCMISPLALHYGRYTMTPSQSINAHNPSQT